MASFYEEYQTEIESMAKIILDDLKSKNSFEVIRDCHEGFSTEIDFYEATMEHVQGHNYVQSHKSYLILYYSDNANNFEESQGDEAVQNHVAVNGLNSTIHYKAFMAFFADVEQALDALLDEYIESED